MLKCLCDTRRVEDVSIIEFLRIEILLKILKSRPSVQMQIGERQISYHPPLFVVGYLVNRS